MKYILTYQYPPLDRIQYIKDLAIPNRMTQTSITGSEVSNSPRVRTYIFFFAIENHNFQYLSLPAGRKNNTSSLPIKKFIRERLLMPLCTGTMTIAMLNF